MLNSQPTLKTLLEHRSIRKYTGEPIDDKVLTAILEAGRAVSTSSFYRLPVSFVWWIKISVPSYAKFHAI